MNLMRVHRSFFKIKYPAFQNYSQQAVLEENEYTETPVYPPILDMSLNSRKKREREILHEKIKKINTVEEKQIALNMPRYYGIRCIMLNENNVPFNAMPLVQSYTRSHFIPMENLPDFYTDLKVTAEKVAKEILSQVEDAISFETGGVSHVYSHFEADKENQATKNIVRQINRIICNHLTDYAPHILYAQVDYDPKHEAFWYVGGTDIPKNVIQWRRQFKWLRSRLYEPIDRGVQYIGSPLIALRSRLPLQPLIPYSEAENPEFKVPKFTTNPAYVGYFAKHRHGTNIPGFWPGDHDEFGVLSIHGRGHILERTTYGEEDNIEALHCQALKASFGWLLAQASYQGFTTYNDLTYPLSTQTVITNGQLWSFYAYQLNTVVMHNEHMDSNPKHNVCFGTPPLKLYDSIENGVVKGLNEEVLKMLVQFYLNAPQKRDHEMKPYLGATEQLIADIEDDNKRCWLEERYKLLVSNRPRHKLSPEVYMWENIYKIQHNTRFFEAKRRPFELDINPYKRRLDEHLPKYIPKVLRPYPKARKKFETTYYPDV